MRGLAVIPARGGSKGVPRKNIRFLAGRPLIEYSISIALACPYIDRVIVSTDDDDIANIARAAGAEVPWLRPAALAQDDTSTMQVLQDLSYRLFTEEGYEPNFILLLQPTSPFRTLDDVNHAIELYQTTQCDEVVSVVKSKYHPNWCFHAADDRLVPYEEAVISRRQDLTPVYALNGAVYVYSSECIVNGVTKKPKYFIEMPEERSIDIDTEFDFQLAELVMAHGIVEGVVL
ncbi:cytidylyltransferase domain-containing protein [Alicyclobacillus ferrooxydans]|uniref:Acylneuraminate cytidylyltransferase n=1 Tax=Alicyclobacillus ferrooxydans TaxID=471514 RepID=A0A0P9EZ46_9BACL|nr:acylneuraminate cytidylyltransferase family protein [Alicyclobacillus ferrooxydans]KPV44369.1 hypothetical protein AN477_06975 [Alicyclobacillus ferrooxydans]